MRVTEVRMVAVKCVSGSRVKEDPEVAEESLANLD